MQRLLVVEDDNSVRTTITTFLELEGYTGGRRVVHAGGPGAPARSDAYPIVISDIYLDERTGLDVLATARQKNPALRGYSDDRARQHRNRHESHAGRRVRLHRQAVRTGPHARHGTKRAEASFSEHDEEKESEIDDLPDSEMIGSSATDDRDLQNHLAGGAYHRHGAD